MANRTFSQFCMSLPKRVVSLWGVFTVAENGTPTLQKWNYPSLAPAAAATRTYTAATTATAPVAGTGAWPSQYARGTEGIGAVARTATGLWTVTLQDNYQRCFGIFGFQSIAGGTANIISIAENTTISAVGTAGGSLIGVALLSATATLADPTSGSTITLRFDLQDATEP